MRASSPASVRERSKFAVKHISMGGLNVSRIGLGAMSMFGYYNVGKGSDAESIRGIHRALDPWGHRSGHRLA
jgi:hypothetical protein